MTLKLSKCLFFKQQIEYLVREISKDVIRPGTSKIEAVLEMKVPTNVKEIRQFVDCLDIFANLLKIMHEL